MYQDLYNDAVDKEAIKEELIRYFTKILNTDNNPSFDFIKSFTPEQISKSISKIVDSIIYLPIPNNVEDFYIKKKIFEKFKFIPTKKEINILKDLNYMFVDNSNLHRYYKLEPNYAIMDSNKFFKKMGIDISKCFIQKGSILKPNKKFDEFKKLKNLLIELEFEYYGTHLTGQTRSESLYKAQDKAETKLINQIRSYLEIKNFNIDRIEEHLYSIKRYLMFIDTPEVFNPHEIENIINAFKEIGLIQVYRIISTPEDLVKEIKTNPKLADFIKTFKDKAEVLKYTEIEMEYNQLQDSHTTYEETPNSYSYDETLNLETLVEQKSKITNPNLAEMLAYLKEKLNADSSLYEIIKNYITSLCGEETSTLAFKANYQSSKIIAWPIERTSFNTLIHETLHAISTSYQLLGLNYHTKANSFMEIVTEFLALRICKTSPNIQKYIIEDYFCRYTKTCELLWDFLVEFEPVFVYEFFLNTHYYLDDYAIGHANYLAIIEATNTHLNFDNLSLFSEIYAQLKIKVENDNEFMTQVDEILNNPNLTNELKIEIEKYRKIIEDTKALCSSIIEGYKSNITFQT